MFTYSLWVTWMLYNHDNCQNIWEKRTWLNMWSHAPSICEVEWRSRFCHRWAHSGPTVEYCLRPATHIQRRPDVVVLSGREPGDVIVNHRLCCGFDLVVGAVDSASGGYVAETRTGPCGLLTLTYIDLHWRSTDIRPSGLYRQVRVCVTQGNVVGSCCCRVIEVV